MQLQKQVQQGFTLIEFMIALVLGLIITAAAIKIFYTGYLSNNIQQSGSELVDSSVFGADYFIKHLQRTNLGAIADSENGGGYFLNHRTALGGIVLTAPTDLSVFGSKLPNNIIVPNNLRGLNYEGGLISNDLLSKSGSGNQSDQLTIQYQMREANKTDCMGRAIKKDDYVIERYFVREAGLACASAIYTYNHNDAQNNNGVDISIYNNPDGTQGANVLDGNGTILIPNVEFFRVLLGTTEIRDFVVNPDTLNIAYIPIPSQTDLDNTFGLDINSGTTQKRIVSMQIGLLLRATNPINAPDKTYNVIDKQITPSSDGKSRDVYTGTVLIRNARGVV